MHTSSNVMTNSRVKPRIGTINGSLLLIAQNILTKRSRLALKRIDTYNSLLFLLLVKMMTTKKSFKNNHFCTPATAPIFWIYMQDSVY